jgi:hypothetical protein
VTGCDGTERSARSVVAGLVAGGVAETVGN